MCQDADISICQCTTKEEGEITAKQWGMCTDIQNANVDCGKKKKSVGAVFAKYS